MDVTDNSAQTIAHDASLSREDLYHGDDVHFSATIFNSFIAKWTWPTVSFDLVKAARKARIAASKATNPQFSMTSDQLEISARENVLYTTVFSKDNGNNLQRQWVEVFFRESCPWV